MKPSIWLISAIVPFLLPALPASARISEVNCMATATPQNVPWGSRYTYWLQGAAEVDDSGQMLPLSEEQAENWSLLLTSALSSSPITLDVTRVENETPVAFAFPATSLMEWNHLRQRSATDATVVFSAEGVQDGLYAAIRKPQTPAYQPLFQVVHFLAPDFTIVSDVSVCMVLASDPMQTDLNEAMVVPFETLKLGAYSGITEPFARVIRDRVTWERFWAKLHANEFPVSPVPPMDFDRHIVLAVGLGERNTGGYSIDVTDVRLQDDLLVVDYRERRSCGIVTQALTQPYHIVTIDRPNQPVRFQHQVENPDCSRP